jgi:hypothetical protein
LISLYQVTGPNWNGTSQEEMMLIKCPTNQVPLGGRILVNGPHDVPDVRTLQDKFVLSPLSLFEGRTNSYTGTTSNAPKEVPVSPQPVNIPTTGIKIFDEIGKKWVRCHSTGPTERERRR